MEERAAKVGLTNSDVFEAHYKHMPWDEKQAYLEYRIRSIKAEAVAQGLQPCLAVAQSLAFYLTIKTL